MLSTSLSLSVSNAAVGLANDDDGDDDDAIHHDHPPQLAVIPFEPESYTRNNVDTR